jgi:hypothetical protein
MATKKIEGFGERDKGAAAFLKPDNTNPFETSASGHSYQGERWDDERGYRRGLGVYSSDDTDSFLRPSQDRTDHGEGSLPDQYHLIDDQVDQPAGPMLGGGGPVSKNKGVGAGPPRFKPKTGPQSNGGL